MKLLESFLMALTSLRANKLRTALTMLGMIIGVGAVITLMSVGRGVQAGITSYLEDMGTNVLYVAPSTGEGDNLMSMSYSFITASLTLDDAEALKSIPGVEAVVAVNENYITISAEGESTTSIIHGGTPEYQDVYAYNVWSGQFISDRNVASRDTVVVFGADVAEALFGDEDPVGEQVKMKGERFTVIGVLEARGGGMMGVSFDNIVVVPITTYQTKLFTQRTPSGEDAVQSISLKVAGAEYMVSVEEEIEEILRRRHHLADDENNDFTIMSQEQFLQIFNMITSMITILLGAIASISLLVGSIGIMNIMLVSVTERTREIGIRKAVGAKRRDILLQFLIEAAMLSLVGGAIGIACGWALSWVISFATAGTDYSLQAVISADIVLLAVSVSIFIGLVSGIYPAMRAARLNPIDALHYE